MAKLQDILYKVHLKEVHGSTSVEVNDIQIVMPYFGHDFFNGLY